MSSVTADIVTLNRSTGTVELVVTDIPLPSDVFEIPDDVFEIPVLAPPQAPPQAPPH